MAYMYKEGKTWRLVFYKNGTSKDIGLGTDLARAKTLKSSIELRLRDEKFKKQFFETLVALGMIDANTSGPVLSSKLSWKESVERVLEHMRKIGRAEKTVDLARRALESIQEFLKPEFPSDITPSKADEWIQILMNTNKEKQELHKRSFKAAGVSAYVRSASSCFTRFTRWGFVDKNPFLLCDKPQVDKSLPNPFDPKDLKKILATSGLLLARAINLMVESGMRPDELFHLKWKHVQLGPMPTIGIKRDGDWNPKMHHERIIPCSQELKRILGPAGSPESYALGTSMDGKPFSTDWLKKAFSRATVRAGLTNKKYTPYCCRDTYATNLALQGYQAHDISARLGHRNITTSMRYVSLARLLQDAGRMNGNTDEGIKEEI